MPFAADFPQQVLLLLLTALLIPAIFRIVDADRGRREREHAAELTRQASAADAQAKLRELEHAASLARQSKVLDAQWKLLDDLSAALWKWRYQGIQVTYYANLGDRQYGSARDRYEEQSWEILEAFQNVVSRSRRLVSERAYLRLRRLYRLIRDVDRELSRLGDKSYQLNEYFVGPLSDEIDQAIALVGQELHLNAPGVHVEQSESPLAVPSYEGPESQDDVVMS